MHFYLITFSSFAFCLFTSLWSAASNKKGEIFKESLFHFGMSPECLSFPDLWIPRLTNNHKNIC